MEMNLSVLRAIILKNEACQTIFTSTGDDNGMIYTAR